jgi:hypothetical protein
MQKGGDNIICKRKGGYFLCNFLMKQKKCYASTLRLILDVANCQNSFQKLFK